MTLRNNNAPVEWIMLALSGIRTHDRCYLGRHVRASGISVCVCVGGCAVCMSAPASVRGCAVCRSAPM